MTKQITDYTANTTGIATGNVISSASEITSRTNIATAINNSNLVLTEHKQLLEGLTGSDYIIDIDSTKFTTSTNEIGILADAITWWDQSVYDADNTATATITGWGAKTLSSLTSSNTFYVWASYVSGVKDYLTTNVLSALPSDISERALIAIAEVDGAGAVTLTYNRAKPLEMESNYFQKPQYFLGGIPKNTKEITDSDSPYTASTRDDYVFCDTSSGNITVNLYASSGNEGKEITLLKTSDSNTLTIDGNSTETISGRLTYKLYLADDTVTLYCDGSNWHIKGGLPYRQLIKEVTISSPATSVEFTANLGDHDQHIVEMNQMYGETATGNEHLGLKLSADAGSTWLASNYNAATYYHSFSSGAYAGSGVTSSFRISGLYGVPDASTETAHGYLLINDLRNTAYTNGWWEMWLITGSGNNNKAQTSLMYRATGVHNGISFFNQNAPAKTLDGGTFKLYGVNI